jgi:hypothetical protein
MNHSEFSRRVSHNTKVLKETIKAKKPVIDILSKIYTFDTEPGELNSAILLRKGHDMLPATYLGLLANTKRVGADAFKFQRNNCKVSYELKTSEVNSKLIWKGVRGGLYLGLPGNTQRSATLTSSLSAQYTLDTQNIIASKNINTVLMISDSNKDGYVAAYALDGETVVEYINRTSCKNREVKLCTFQAYGKEIETVIPLIGFDAWKQSIISNL